VDLSPKLTPSQLSASKIRHVASSDHSGYVYLSDLGLGCILIVKITCQRGCGAPCPLPLGSHWKVRMHKPMGLILDSHDNMLVASLHSEEDEESAGCLEALDQQGYYLRTFNPRSCDSPANLVLHRDQLFVADFRSKTVRKYRALI